MTNGLTLNGIALVGNPTNSWWGGISFAGTQTLGGNGAVVFGSQGNNLSFNTLRLANADTTLTIGPRITIRGQNGAIGYDPDFWGGPQNVAVINQGTISPDVANGTMTVNVQGFADQGSISVSAGATLNVSTSATFGDSNALLMQEGGTLQLGGDLLGNTRNVDKWLPDGTLSFASGAHQMEAMSLDLGNLPDGYVHNFAYGTISLAPGAQVTLVDRFTNSAEPPAECVYTTSLIVPSGSTLNLNGLHLYATFTQIAGTVTGGAVTQTPAHGGPLTLNTIAPGTISAAGALDEFTFFGRGGEHVAISVDTGSAGVLPPQLNYALVQLFDPSTNLVAQGSNTVAQNIVGLPNIILPVDGTYTVAVRAPANHSASTGNYLVTVWDATPTVASLVVNQQANGQIATPFSVDEWNFSATAGQQIRFDLINVSGPGAAFILNGPSGWSGFSNLVTSSSLLTLPSSGGYSLTAYGTGQQYGINFALELVQTAETNLALGSTFTEQFVGNGQAQLIAINVTNSNPMRISLSLGSPGSQVKLYAKLGSPPTPSDYDFSYDGVASQSEDIVIPSVSPGKWYVLIYGDYVPQLTPYSLQVVQNSLIVESFAPNTAGSGIKAVSINNIYNLLAG